MRKKRTRKMSTRAGSHWKRLDTLTDRQIRRAIRTDQEARATHADFWKGARVVMPKAKKTTTIRATAEKIAEMATRGVDISTYFTNRFTVVRPLRGLEADLSPGMLRELDARAMQLRISRQEVIKRLLRQALNQTPVRSTTRSKRAV